MQKNLEQIRALHAYRFWYPEGPNTRAGGTVVGPVTGTEGGNVVAKLGPLILECGLLSTLAFAKNKGAGYETLLKEVGRFLGCQGTDGRHLLPKTAPTLAEFIQQLTQNDSPLLRQATSEALIYVGYLKRFAPPPTKKKPEQKAEEIANPMPI